MAEFPVRDEDIKALRVDLLRALSAATYPKESIGPIAAKHDMTVDDVRALVEPYGYPDKSAMARNAFELVGANPPPPARPQQLAAVRANGPAEPPNLTHGTLLVAGEKSAKARTRRLAARIRAEIAELRGLVNSETADREAAAKADAEKAKLRAEVKQLEEQLAAKKAALSSKPAPKPKAAGDSDAASPKEIRAWAAVNGVDCPAMGRVPAVVVEAYEAAKGAVA